MPKLNKMKHINCTNLRATPILRNVEPGRLDLADRDSSDLDSLALISSTIFTSFINNSPLWDFSFESFYQALSDKDKSINFQFPYSREGYS